MLDIIPPMTTIILPIKSIWVLGNPIKRLLSYPTRLVPQVVAMLPNRHGGFVRPEVTEWVKIRNLELCRGVVKYRER